MQNIIVTTTDIKREYDIIGPIYFQLSNKGLFSSDLTRLSKVYKEELQAIQKQGLSSETKADWGFLYGEFSFGMQNDFDKAFYIAVREIQKRASKIGADAIIGMRQDIDMDTNQFQYFYLQMYGTAVKFK
ncbi:heavy metal-binding domain-containing protein [Flavobacterium sp.]|uniref:heavy metal-binding domain-containing protein n=1 Tax=Flavobacterium sp. TaxID=239 RepID=UPI00286B269F|nr:heavy metal-binding domain-containing protein [Flavobacterium sp.]